MTPFKSGRFDLLDCSSFRSAPVLTGALLAVALASACVSQPAARPDAKPQPPQPAGQPAAPIAPIELGAQAPPIELEKLLQAPTGAKAELSNSKGKVIVLEFWATWCAPCIAAIPHFNELTEQFKDRPVRFVSLTMEDEATVTPFLARRHIQGWVGLDLDGSVFEAYGAQGVPKTVVVDQNGKIASISRPNVDPLTAENIEQILSGQMPLSAPRKPDHETSAVPNGIVDTLGSPTDSDPPQLGITIKLSKASGNAQLSGGPGRYQATGAGLSALLNDLCGTNELKIEVPSQLQSTRYDIDAKLKDASRAAVNEFVLHSLETALVITVQRVKREADVYVLTAPDQLTGDLKPSLAPASSGAKISSSKGVSAAKNADIKFLANHIEAVLKVPVVDETNLKARYDWEMLYDSKNPSSIIEAAHRDLGVELKSGRRVIEILSVELNRDRG